jgi:2-methylisocitrate lyase-like PEP mutase family enzyme
MGEDPSARSSAIATFRELHASGRFVMPNPWDAGSAVALQGLGFEALATTSADLGVRRVSVGSALARVAWGAFLRAARSLATAGSFDAFAEAASFAELNALFRGRLR